MTAQAINQAFDSSVFADLSSKEVTDAGKEHTCELLDNLGYLNLALNNNQPVSKDKRQKALNAFRLQLKSCTLPNTPIGGGGDQLSAQETTFLEHLTALDGSFKLAPYSQQQIADQKLLTRVLNYRLSILSLTQQNMAGEFGNATNTALLKLSSQSNIQDSQKNIALTDNVDTLTDYLLKQVGQGVSNYCGVVYFENKSNTVAEKDFTNNSERFLKKMAKLEGPNQLSQSKLIKEASADGGFFSRGIEGLSRQQREQISMLSANFANRFFIRLIHLQLFLAGTYDGKIDSDMGPMALQAISDYVTMENHDEDNITLNITDFIIKIDDDVWAINAVALLKAMLVEPDAKNNTKQVGIGNSIAHATKDMPEQKQKELYDTLNGMIDKQTQSAGNKPMVRSQKSPGFFQRIGAFFKRVGKAIKRGFDTIINAIKTLFKWIKNGIKLLIMEIREGIAKLKRAVIFIFGDRTITTDNITTQFDFDFDASTNLSSQIDPQILDKHIAKLTSISTAVSDTAKFLSTLIPTIIDLLEGPLGWLGAGIRLVKLLLDSPFEFSAPNFAVSA